MRITVSVIKADVGSVGGHLQPSPALRQTIANVVRDEGAPFLIDHRVGSFGDDVFILMTHTRGLNDETVHHLAWEAFLRGTACAKREGLYGAGQDLLKDAFSGNVRGMGPAVAELEFEERTAEPFVLFGADKTEPGAYNLPLYLAFADPMFCSGLLLSSKIKKGFTFRILDVAHAEADRFIDLQTPEDLYDLAALLRDNERFVVASIHSRATGDIAAAVSTTRLHNIAGKYTGKDDPVALVRTQQNFPATGEVLAPYRLCHYVGGFMRGSHTGPLMPVRAGTGVSFFDGPPIVTALAFSMSGGNLTQPVDAFDHPFWDHVRTRAAEKAITIREQGFSGNAMLPQSELEYGGIVEILDALEPRFRIAGAMVDAPSHELVAAGAR
ncbi:MAG: fructose 1,6-bisphosphatase [Planctomycetes bacterium]|nr:fructose 1,6-bisphosphatase [Planctomycetota bacterium]MBI3846975.1 fructose 1,6-bisphosphatase [Planctomycetota bacterium]